MHLRFQSHTRHADWLADALVVVDQILLWQHMQHALIGRNRNSLSSVQHALDVLLAHLAITNRHDAVGVEAADVAAGDACIDCANLAARHQLGFFDGTLNRLHGRLNVDDNALLQAARTLRSDSDHLQFAVIGHLSNHRDDFRCSDIEADDLPAAAVTRTLQSIAEFPVHFHCVPATARAMCCCSAAWMPARAAPSCWGTCCCVFC